MSRKFKLISSLVLTIICLAALGISVAFAITIVVDGDRESAWDGSQPGSQSDNDESAISGQYDIEEVKWTNNPNNFYILIDTYGTPHLFDGFGQTTRIYICIDTDNDQSNGEILSNCDETIKFDYVIYIQGEAQPAIYHNNTNTGKTGTLGYDTSATTPVIEVSVANADIGLSGSNCGSMPAVVYFDNGIGDPDDRTPDTGTMTFNCGTPTAVTLSSFEGKSPNHALWSVGGGLAVAALSAGGLFLINRKKVIA